MTYYRLYYYTQLNFYLDKFRTDITDMVNSQIGSWAVHHSITDNWGASQDNYLQYSTCDTNEANSDTRQFVVPFGCKLEIYIFILLLALIAQGEMLHMHLMSM